MKRRKSGERGSEIDAGVGKDRDGRAGGRAIAAVGNSIDGGYMHDGGYIQAGMRGLW